VDNQGERGDSGQRGVAGERGPKGDHGQHGEIGDTGLKGVEGPRGPQGIQGKTEPVKIWFGINRWTWAGIAFAFIVLVGAYTNHRIENKFSRQVQLFSHHSVDQDYKTCLNTNRNVDKIRELIIFASSPAIRVDVTKVEGFDAQPQAVKEYLNNLRLKTEELNASTEGFRVRALAGFNRVNCEEEFPSGLHGVEGP